MADERDNENEPKIRVVDRRMLNEEEREGKAEAPKLEIIGGGRSAESEAEAPEAEAAEDTTYAAAEGRPAEGFEEEEELTEEEEAQLRAQLENEQFAAIEQQMGRPLTAQEKDV